MPTHEWQFFAAKAVEQRHRTVVVWPRLSPTEQALLRSCRGCPSLLFFLRHPLGSLHSSSTSCFFGASGLCTHTPAVARTIFCTTLYTLGTSHAWEHTRMAQGHMKKGVCSVLVVSLHLAFSTLMSHPSSLLFPDNLIDTAFQSLTFTDLLPGLSRPKSAGPAHFRTSEDDFGYMAKSHHLTSRLRGSVMQSARCSVPNPNQEVHSVTLSAFSSRPRS